MNMRHQEKIVRAFHNVENFYHNHFSRALENFLPGLDSETLQVFESKSSLNFPKEVRALYQLKNGEGPRSWGTIGGWIWLPLEKAMNIKEEFIQLEQTHPSGGYDAEVAFPIFYYQGEILYIKMTDCSSVESPLYFRNSEYPVEEKKFNSLADFFVGYLQELKKGSFVFMEYDNGNFDIRPVNRELWLF